jgi:hypothetical protein
MSHRFSNVALTLTLATALWLSASPAFAQEDGAPAINSGSVSLSLGFDVTTQYMFRGIFQEDQGLIIQPWGEVGFNLHEADSGITSVDLTIGIWNSFHSGPSGNGAGAGGVHGPGAWYEADLYAGVGLTFSDVVEVSVTYVSLSSPDPAGNMFAEEILLGVALDDSASWGDGFDGLQPYIMFAFEIDGASDGVGNGGDVYFEFGIEPSFEVLQSETLPVTLSVPVTVGLSLDDYYEFDQDGDGDTDDDTFGYIDVGFVLGMPAWFIPSDYGDWSMAMGVHLIFLGDATEAGNSATDDSEIIGTFGLSMEY